MTTMKLRSRNQRVVSASHRPGTASRLLGNVPWAMTTTRDGASPSGRQTRACSRWWLPAASIIGIQWICSRQGPSGLATGPAAGWARAPPTNAGAKIKLAVTIATNQRVTFIEDRSEPTRKAEGSVSNYALIAHTEVRYGSA